MQFGTDADIGGSNRSDVIMLVHTDPRLQKAIVLSFPRDLWVNIPGRGFDKINAAFSGGLARVAARNWSRRPSRSSAASRSTTSSTWTSPGSRASSKPWAA